jgi:FixJ family two-component response regulator
MEEQVTARPVVSIVDDDPSVRDSLADLVRAMGFEVNAFDSAERFLGSDHLDSTSCLISDMRMPGISALELHSRLIASGRQIPTIIVTAFPKSADQARAKRAGVVCYLRKPWDPDELAECIRLAIKSFETRP